MGVSVNIYFKKVKSKCYVYQILCFVNLLYSSSKIIHIISAFPNCSIYKNTNSFLEKGKMYQTLKNLYPVMRYSELL